MKLEEEAKKFMEQKKTPGKEGLDRQAVRFYLGQVISSGAMWGEEELRNRVQMLIKLENELTWGS
jgi:hypothetical protein